MNTVHKLSFFGHNGTVETHEAINERPQRVRGAVRAALVREAVELAREGGPDAVVLREVARRVGVAPNAAYRHFSDRDALLLAVCHAAMELLAGEMRAELEEEAAEPLTATAAKKRLAAVSRAYLRFAREHDGLFRAAFAVPDHLDYSSAGRSGPNDQGPFDILGEVVADLVRLGLVAPESLDSARVAAWSGVHGLAELHSHGPLRTLTRAQTESAEQAVIEMIVSGVTSHRK